jgi:hypothetical protein
VDDYIYLGYFKLDTVDKWAPKDGEEDW